MPDLNMKYLRTFLIQVEEKSTAKTARRVGVSQNSVTGHLRVVEEAVGRPLLEKRFPPSRAEAGRTQLTEAGRAFLPKAIKAMAAHDAMFDDAFQIQDPREVSRITASRLVELALAALRHDLSEDDQKEISKLL